MPASLISHRCPRKEKEEEFQFASAFERLVSLASIKEKRGRVSFCIGNAGLAVYLSIGKAQGRIFILSATS
jgi:hypothetical protein